MFPDDEKIEELREKLRDYYGTAAASGMPAALLDLAKVENMDDDEILKEAEKNHIR